MKISIPKPCTENWNQMTASEKGRFCTSCQTQVINFKGMPVEEIKHFLEQEAGSSCGRFSTHQIETFNAAYQEIPSPSNLRQWTMAAVLAGVSALPSFAQDNPSIPSVPLLNTSVSYYHYELQETKTTTALPTGDTIVLVGRVIDIDLDERLPFATVVVAGTKIGTSTDFDGNFLLKVPKSKEAITLEVHYTGYATLFHSIIPNSNQTDLILKIENGSSYMGMISGLMIVSKKEQRAHNRAYKKELRAERKKERVARKK